MIDDRVDFDNTLRTLQCPTPAADWEDDAYAAMRALINWQQLTPVARHAWSRGYIYMLHEGNPSPMKTMRGGFYDWLNRLRLQAFGDGVDSEFRPDSLILFPWALTDVQFQLCMLNVKQGTMPDREKFKSFYLSKAGASSAEQAAETVLYKAIRRYIQKGLVAGIVIAIGLIIKLKNAVGIGLAVDFAWELASVWFEKVRTEDLVARYKVDEVRRIHLASKGLSSYQNITNIP